MDVIRAYFSLYDLNPLPLTQCSDDISYCHSFFVIEYFPSVLWCKGYYVDTVGKNTKAIKEYIENQLKMDRESDQISLYDPRDPFTGSK